MSKYSGHRLKLPYSMFFINQSFERMLMYLVAITSTGKLPQTSDPWKSKTFIMDIDQAMECPLHM